MSTYRPRLFLWREIAFDAAIFSVGVPMRVWYPLLGCAAAIFVRLVGRRSPSAILRIDESGVHFRNMEVEWSNIASIDRGGPVIARSDCLVLERPLTYPKWLSFQQIRKISLERYERDWVNGRVGQDVARWAPHLLEGRDRAHA